MAEAYVTRLWLTCDSEDPTVVSAFQARWTRAIETAWQALVLAYDPTKTDAQNQDRLCTYLSGKVDGQFAQPAGGVIRTDLGDAGFVYQSTIPVFNTSSWSIGSGGLHESKQPVNANVVGGRAQWSVRGANGASGFVFGHCEWSKVAVDAN